MNRQSRPTSTKRTGKMADWIHNLTQAQKPTNPNLEERTPKKAKQQKRNIHVTYFTYVGRSDQTGRLTRWWVAALLRGG